MSYFLNKDLNNLTPYSPEEQLDDKRYIKLNSNESPYSPPSRVIKAINSKLTSNLNFYCDPYSQELVDEISRVYNVNSNQVIIGNGSDEILAFCLLAFFNTIIVQFCLNNFTVE